MTPKVLSAARRKRIAEKIRESLQGALHRRYDLGAGRRLDLRIGTPVKDRQTWGAACSIRVAGRRLEVLLFQIDPICAVLEAIHFARRMVPSYAGAALPRLRREWGPDLGLGLPAPARRRRRP